MSESEAQKLAAAFEGLSQAVDREITRALRLAAFQGLPLNKRKLMQHIISSLEMEIVEEGKDPNAST